VLRHFWTTSETNPAEIFQVGERTDDDLAESSGLAVSGDVGQIQRHHRVDRVDTDE